MPTHQPLPPHNPPPTSKSAARLLSSPGRAVGPTTRRRAVQYPCGHVIRGRFGERIPQARQRAQLEAGSPCAVCELRSRKGLALIPPKKVSGPARARTPRIAAVPTAERGRRGAAEPAIGRREMYFDRAWQQVLQRELLGLRQRVSQVEAALARPLGTAEQELKARVDKLLSVDGPDLRRTDEGTGPVGPGLAHSGSGERRPEPWRSGEQVP
jgi:hypothetical protein